MVWSRILLWDFFFFFFFFLEFSILQCNHKTHDLLPCLLVTQSSSLCFKILLWSQGFNTPGIPMFANESLFSRNTISFVQRPIVNLFWENHWMDEQCADMPQRNKQYTVNPPVCTYKLSSWNEQLEQVSLISSFNLTTCQRFYFYFVKKWHINAPCRSFMLLMSYDFPSIIFHNWVT